MQSIRSLATPVVRHADARFCVASCASMVIAVWGRVAVADDVRALGRVQREVVAEHGYCMVLTIIRAGLETTLEDGVREAGQDNAREFAGVNRGAALIIEGGGFRLVFFRSILTSQQLLSRTPIKQRVFDSIDGGVQWLLERPGVEPWLLDEADSVIAAAYRCADTYGLPHGDELRSPR